MGTIRHLRMMRAVRRGRRRREYFPQRQIRRILSGLSSGAQLTVRSVRCAVALVGKFAHLCIAVKRGWDDFQANMRELETRSRMRRTPRSDLHPVCSSYRKTLVSKVVLFSEGMKSFAPPPTTAAKPEPPPARQEQRTFPPRPAAKRKLVCDPSHIPAKRICLDSKISQPWLPHLGLKEIDRDLFQSPFMGTPNTICVAATEIMKKQFEAVPGAPSVRLVRYNTTPVSGPTVQIHIDALRLHAFTSCYLRGKVMVADTGLNNNPNLGAFTTEQLQKSYESVVKNPLENIKFIPVQQQPRGNPDCVCYAIANAYELMVPDGNPTCQYRREAMRSHLLDCLNQGVIREFPKVFRPITIARDGFTGLKIVPWK